MLTDDIIDEVRQIRESHAARFNFDLWAIYADLQKSQAARIAAGHPVASSQSVAPQEKFQRIHTQASPRRMR